MKTSFYHSSRRERIAAARSDFRRAAWYQAATLIRWAARRIKYLPLNAGFPL